MKNFFFYTMKKNNKPIRDIDKSLKNGPVIQKIGIKQNKMVGKL